MTQRIGNEAWLICFVMGLLLLSPMGGARAEIPAVDEIEQLDEVEVTAPRIAPLPRAVPFQLPDLSSVSPLSPDNSWKRGVPMMQELRGAAHAPLRDNTALVYGKRTAAGYDQRPKPAYPTRARTDGWEGTVFLEVVVLPDGSVAEVKIKESSGHASLDKEAIAAVQGTRFSPQMDGGFAIPGTVVVPVRFKLTDPVEAAPVQ